MDRAELNKQNITRFLPAKKSMFRLRIYKVQLIRLSGLIHFRNVTQPSARLRKSETRVMKRKARVPAFLPLHTCADESDFTRIDKCAPQVRR